MNNKAPAHSENRTLFAILGFCLGLVFVVIGIVIALFTQGFALGGVNYFQVLLGNPYLWVLYLLPFLLATVFGWAGGRADELIWMRQKTRKFAQQIIAETRLYKEKAEEAEQKQQQAKISLEEMGSATQLQQEDLRSVQLDLDQSEAVNEVLFRFSPLAAVLLDPDQIILDSNLAFTELFGYSQADIVGEFLDDLICPVEQSAEARQFAELVRAGEPVQAAAIRRKQDGSEFQAEIFGLPVQQQKEVCAILALYRDASQPLHLPEIGRFEIQAEEPETDDIDQALTWLPDESFDQQAGELDDQDLPLEPQGDIEEIPFEYAILGEILGEYPDAGGDTEADQEIQAEIASPPETNPDLTSNWEDAIMRVLEEPEELDGFAANPPDESDLQAEV